LVTEMVKSGGSHITYLNVNLNISKDK